jgi:hypothetical protein
MGTQDAGHPPFVAGADRSGMAHTVPLESPQMTRPARPGSGIFQTAYDSTLDGDMTGVLCAAGGPASKRVRYPLRTAVDAIAGSRNTGPLHCGMHPDGRLRQSRRS